MDNLQKEWLLRTKTQKPFDCAEISDLRGMYFHNRILKNYEGRDFSGCVLYKCYPPDLKGAVSILPFSSEEEARSLVGVDLSRLKLNDWDLSEADLRGANFAFTKFYNTNLRDADFENADLSHVEFYKSNLLRANMVNVPQSYLKGNKKIETWRTVVSAGSPLAKMPGSDVLGPNLNLGGITLTRKDLQDVDLSFCNLKGASFPGCNLKRANLEGADLEGANFVNADLEEANLLDSSAIDTIFFKANLKRADLRNVDFSGAKLKRSKLQGADLTGATLDGGYFDVSRSDAPSETNLKRAQYSSTTKFPTERDWSYFIKHWEMVKTFEKKD